MCRWVLYYGDRMLLSHLLTQPDNSLLKQTEPGREVYTPGAETEQGFTMENWHARNHIVNGDGFGLAWYPPFFNRTKSVCYKSTNPAWNEANFGQLCDGVKADLVFAHVRAASPGSLISRENCHPFIIGRYTFMHNGGVNSFQKIRRKIRNSVRDDIEAKILGTTDSEHVFALFLNFLPDLESMVDVKVLVEAMRSTLLKLVELTKEVAGGPSSLNLCLSDGVSVVACRFRNCPNEAPPALYVAHGGDFQPTKTGFHMRPASETSSGLADTVLIASEPLSHRIEDWKAIPANHIVSVHGKTDNPVELTASRKPTRKNPELVVTLYPVTQA